MRRRWIVGIGAFVLSLFGALWLLTSFVVNFSPSRQRLQAADFERLAAQVPGVMKKVRLTSSDGVDIVAWYLPAQPAPGTERWGIIFTHGGGDDKSFYLPLAQQLRQEGFDVILPDLRGHGESAPSPRGLTLGITEGRDVAAAAAFLADKIGIRHIAAGGVSMGGIATVMGAAAEPRIGPLIIESSSHQAQTVFDYMLATFRLPAGAVRSNLAHVITQFGLWRMGASWPEIRDGVLPTWHLASALAPRPVIFLFGDNDPFVTESAIADYCSRFAGNPQIVLFKNTGHGVYPAHPQAYSSYILHFLDDWRAQRADLPARQTFAPPAELKCHISILNAPQNASI